MANPQRGEIALEVNGREYILALDLNALCELQAVIKPSDPDSVELDVVFAKVGRMNPTYTRAFLWALLRRHHRDVTLAQTSDLVVDAGGFSAFFDKLGTILGMMRPDAKDAPTLHGGNGRPTRAATAAGTGRRSTGKPAKSV